MINTINQQYILTGLVVISGLLFIILIWQIIQSRSLPRADTFLLIQQQIESLREQVRKSLEGHTQLISQQLDGTHRMMGDVQNNLGQLEATNKKVLEVSKEIASLQELLRVPKLRGRLGEFLLEDLLRQILPEKNFSSQYTFKGGQRVDAVIRLGQGLVPVDAKFPLENFRRLLESLVDEYKKEYRKLFLKDVRKHIDSIASKYILPDEGTYDFALMYIPSENVYYETIIKAEKEERDLLEYAMSRRVIPVSPNSFYAYLQVILLGLNGLKIEKNIRQIMGNLGKLREDLQRFEEDYGKLGTNLNRTASGYESCERSLKRFIDHLGQIDLSWNLPEESTKKSPRENTK